MLYVRSPKIVTPQDLKYYSTCFVTLVMVMAGPLLILLCMLFIRATVVISPRINAVLVVV